MRLVGPANIDLAGLAPDSPAGLAARDVLDDLTDALGHLATFADGGVLRLEHQPAWDEERWRIDVAGDRVVIRGGQPLGLVYGLYAFSHRYLGVDPLHVWTDRRPTPRGAIDLPAGTIDSEPPVFRYRGWFLNDEDLLGEWQLGGGERHIDYPFYRQVTRPDVIDRVAESLLRLGGNLIIPASFVDVMNPPEAELVRRCVRRGLFVSQHHVEPMGVSHFGYETFWRSRGVGDARFRYVDEPERLRETWRAFAERWSELAGDRVVWQLGLRGRGDRPIWVDDDAVTRETGGAIISRAIADQWAIACSVDPRPNPPATTTLFMEGSDLMAEGSLTFPEGVAVIFSDAGNTQRMQRDFHEAARDARYRYGAYFHLAFWERGPHLCPGVSPEHVAGELGEVIAKGDTHYAILNVANVREFSRELGPAMTLLRTGDVVGGDAADEAYFAALVRAPTGELVQDGNVVRLTLNALRGRDVLAATLAGLGFDGGCAATFDAAANRMDALAESNAYAGMMAALYRLTATLVRAEPDWRDRAARCVDDFLAARAPLASGDKWRHWYRGDRKANWAGIRRQLLDHDR